jgi:putative pyruvate formate lyase activating enzyme
MERSFRPAYLNLLKSGALEERSRQAREFLSPCVLCPRKCQADRLAGKTGICHSAVLARVDGWGLHTGEEAVISGWRGSGTIFFCGCNLRCVFCQNYQISQGTTGREMAAEELAGGMLMLQESGAHNINLVSPSHVVPQILEALLIAVRGGLVLPLVYNTGGYDSLEVLQLLDGVVDIYMPDMKYSDGKIAEQYSLVKNYPSVNRAAVREMHRQVGDLQVNADGIAERGLLVRHLVLPHGLAGTRQVARLLVDEVSPNTAINVMAQYHPEFKAKEFIPLNRPPTPDEVQAALDTVRQAGLTSITT